MGSIFPLGEWWNVSVDGILSKVRVLLSVLFFLGLTVFSVFDSCLSLSLRFLFLKNMPKNMISWSQFSILGVLLLLYKVVTCKDEKKIRTFLQYSLVQWFSKLVCSQEPLMLLIIEDPNNFYVGYLYHYLLCYVSVGDHENE